ncbi:MAG: riboflavin synthase subunit alpha [Candidatus Raymondbacteria bacterium RifOxyA12_full_50_37]|uniref:Riboflavin synthase n=1 Tax=Candidatus Raymondbacteria bacterium RIFOXYD12_FULL_49_13 TaxID=1817890 RepID=A0A1F7FGI7_UNCRA|nr:MAG: riboflavin synthase subunit alpha [Candidatus Raymondbacteria bacterium RifOxyB12_full_50_8]OGJ91600.1 MAG: riboflavin synthase subunit alpha [Candidatus Raymondbacteria bacterium RifOxyA12_full_50_37]OGJ92906.1 MAG: riboflavin synthase subunit alpha [Candidatus Raymondbacteria bacterium RIFOXYA2_FULL_49_16]OGJ94833.1 MAG: riboflavin synthase subunit alpha [Candidatus Raymondbacteria bacterium RifOxyC12_full_50_8]OGK05708.1 MAG: riboflavin synthase subunit alpha [Candidatus Raymondbacte
MFTGIIEETGSIRGITRSGSGARIDVACSTILAGLKQGDSIAVDGVCLTADSLSSAGFSAMASRETLERSTFKTARPQAAVNLERAMAATGRFGGHFVQGHVDATGTIVRDSRDGGALYRTIRIDQALEKYCIEKGSIAIDGISLTIAMKKNNEMTLVLIPETLRQTTQGSKGIGSAVNIEIDCIAKYVESLLEARQGPLTEHKLREHGF